MQNVDLGLDVFFGGGRRSGESRRPWASALLEFCTSSRRCALYIGELNTTETNPAAQAHDQQDCEQEPILAQQDAGHRENQTPASSSAGFETAVAGAVNLRYQRMFAVAFSPLSAARKEFHAYFSLRPFWSARPLPEKTRRCSRQARLRLPPACGFQPTNSVAR